MLKKLSKRKMLKKPQTVKEPVNTNVSSTLDKAEPLTLKDFVAYRQTFNKAGKLKRKDFRASSRDIFALWVDYAKPKLENLRKWVFRVWLGLPLFFGLGLWVMTWLGRRSSQFECIMTPDSYLRYLAVDGLLASSAWSAFTTAATVLGSWAMALVLMGWAIFEGLGRYFTKYSTTWALKKTLFKTMFAMLAIFTLMNGVKSIEVEQRAKHSQWVALHNKEVGDQNFIAQCLNARTVTVGDNNNIKQ